MDKRVYTRPNKPRYLPVRQRTPHNRDTSSVAVTVNEPLCVDAATECHVTPATVAGRMVEYLGGRVGDRYLEPHGGTGQLVSSVLSTVPGAVIDVVERHVALHQYLRTRFREVPGVTVHHQCFLEYAGELVNQVCYDRIIMNPPFRQVTRHVKTALTLLDPHGGVVVALVPVTFDLPGFECLEELPADTFAHARVNTKLVYHER